MTTSEDQHTKSEKGLKTAMQQSQMYRRSETSKRLQSALQPIETKEDLFLGSPVVSNHFCLAHISDTIKLISFFRDTFPFGPPMLFSSKFERRK